MKRVLVAALTVLGCTSHELKAANEIKNTPSEQKKNLLQVLAEDSDLSSFVSAVQAAGWLYRITKQGPFILLVPTNEAFDQLNTGEKSRLSLPENFHLLVKLVTSHILSGNTLPKEGETIYIRSIGGKRVTLSQQDGTFYVDELKILAPPLKAGNGIILKIDEVLNF
jgi:uncharacterized surface protein with fasciclin (FAS1) repeats